MLLPQVWKVAEAPKNDKYQYTHFAHKINSFDTAPKKLLSSDSRLRPDRYALEMGDMSKSGFEKSRLLTTHSLLVSFPKTTNPKVMQRLIEAGFFFVLQPRG